VSANRAPRRSWWGAAAVLLAAVPMLAAALPLLIQRPLIYADGDYAVDELALTNSEHFQQLLGNYSRFGWSHPGPAWFYLLDTIYAPLGSQTWSFLVAVLLVNALAAALVVAVAWRASSSWIVALAGCGILLAYVGSVGAGTFRDPWPPWAVILPMAVFILLAAVGAAGSTPAIVAAMLLGSYEIQVDIGTTAPVGVMGIAMLVLRLGGDLLSRRAPFWSDLAGSRRRQGVVVAGLALLLVMWLPPLVQEVSGPGRGNLTQVARFFLAPHPKYHLRETASAVGRLLAAFPFGPRPAIEDTTVTSPSLLYEAVVAAFVALAAALALAGAFARDRFLQSLGILLVAAVVCVVLVAREVVGPFYPFVLYWVTILPVVLAIGLVTLAVRFALRLSWRPPRAVPRAGVVLLGAVVLLLAAGQAMSFLALPQVGPLNGRATTAAWRLTATALSGRPRQPVLVEIDTLEMWPIAAGVALQLEKRGDPVRVTPDWVFMFGEGARSTGDEHLKVAIVAPSRIDAYEAANPAARLAGTTSDAGIFIEGG
jgi:hypothetical protein